MGSLGCQRIAAGQSWHAANSNMTAGFNNSYPMLGELYRTILISAGFCVTGLSGKIRIKPYRPGEYDGSWQSGSFNCVFLMQPGSIAEAELTKRYFRHAWLCLSSYPGELSDICLRDKAFIALLPLSE